MAKNQLVQMIQAARNEGRADGLWLGLQLGTNITVISTDHVMDPGAGLLTEVLIEAQRIVDDIVDMDDPEVTEEHIRYEIGRIFGPMVAEKLSLRPPKEEVTR